MKQSIGEFLATLRRANGYTQQEVADRLSVSNRTVSAWERSTAMPDILLLPAIAELYGVTADEILAGERNAEAAPRPALSEKAVKKLLKKKMNAFFTRSLILFGVYLAGLLLFFIGLFVDFSATVWVGWRWWLLPLILGLVVALICAVCIFALWRDAENSADEEGEDRGAFCLLLRKRVALLSGLSAGAFLLFGLACLVPIVAGAFRAAFSVAAAACALVALGEFLFGVLFSHRAERKFGGEEGERIAARNRKLYGRAVLFSLIPMLAGTALFTLFAFWKPETRNCHYRGEAAGLTEYLETLTVMEREYRPDGSFATVAAGRVLPLSELAETAVEGESYALGDGFQCFFRNGKESCTIYRDEPFVVLGSEEAISSLTVFRMYSDDRTFSAYNVCFNVRRMSSWIAARDWRGNSVPREIRIRNSGETFELLDSYRQDYFPLAAPLALLVVSAGAGVCILVCAAKRERPKADL